MLHYITYNSPDGAVQLPIDFNIWTLIRVAKCYNTDLSGLQEVFKSFSNEEDSILFVANVGAVALTEGARREGGGVKKHYDVDDIFDMLTIDMSIAQQLLDNLFATMEGSKVFPMAPTIKEPQKKRRHR